MSLFYFSCLCMFIVFAQQTESRVLILRGYDDQPLVLGHVERSSAEEVKQKVQPISLNYKPKRTHKKTVLQYGRHIYHLDNYADLKDIRSELKPASVSYDYVDIEDIFRVRDPTINGLGDYLKDVVIFSNTPIQICNGDQCDEDLRKNSKHKKDDDTDWKHKKMSFGRMKRFQIVDNRHSSKSKKYDESSEERHKKKKRKSTRKNKKKKKRHTTESTESKESGSAETSSHKKWKKKYKPHKKENISSEESIEIKRRPKKKDDSINASMEKTKNHETDSKSHEDSHKKKKRKKNNYVASDETTRKTFALDDDDFFMQGNKIYHAKERKSKKKHNDFDKRRRLQHFLPKRYHWESSEIHDLGYYWFNGPKGKYPAPKLLY